VLRGPVQLAKTLAAIDALSGGHLVAGVGPGSSPADYAAAGIGFEERWRRFDEAVEALRALLHGDRAGSEGEFYSTLPGATDLRLAARRRGGPCWSCSASASPPSGTDHR
jgi:alkanesulfonate monooxygenase SsuD/methylene tetrahydromethanopterin reductase-like flavin-dependent oxidoreductase (luciferase family)